MAPENNSPDKSVVAGLPFPAEWINSNPWKVEEILSQMALEDQIRCVLQVQAKDRQDLITLSSRATEIVHALAPEEIYQLIKEIGEKDSLAVLSLVSSDQLQYIFDIEWWHGDRFQPERALKWLDYLDNCQESAILEWSQSEELDQKVMLLQALIKVYKKDEMTESYEGVENLPHITFDGVYDIFFKVSDFEPVREMIRLLRDQDPNLYFILMEAVIWYPVIPTVERAFRWRMTRTSDRGIPEYEEALGIYSRLDPESLKVDAPTLDNFSGDNQGLVAPTYPFSQVKSFAFLYQSMAFLEDEKRLDTICWELVNLANKVIVADKLDPSSLEIRDRAMRKVLGYITMGLEAGAEEDSVRGARIIERTWLLFLFQAGYERLCQLKWKAEEFLKRNGELLNFLINEGEKEWLGALVYRFPQLGEMGPQGESFYWRDFRSLEDIRDIERFLDRWEFFVRFCKQSLNLDINKMSHFLSLCRFPEPEKDIDLLTWVTTGLARFTLFNEVDCEPLPEIAAKKFLKMVFLSGVFKDEKKVCSPDMLNEFSRRVLESPLAWVEGDKEFLAGLIREVSENLQDQFGALDLKKRVQWKFTHGLAIKKE